MPLSPLKCALAVSTTLVFMGTSGLGQSEVVDPAKPATAESDGEGHQEFRDAAGRPNVGVDGGCRHRTGRSRLGIRPVRREHLRWFER